ncbi:MAG: hypothetical protein IKZ96_01165 [Bacilli bacterium]|nr:hypothetical protein [Bacilli bacterium]
MLLKKRKEIPKELQLEFNKIQKGNTSEPVIKYSLSLDDDILENANSDILLTKLEPSFKEVLFNFIDSKGLTDPEVYKKAKVDKRLFSKIRNDESKYVSKNTVICLGLALELNQEDFDKLLKANHDVLSDNSYFDIAIKWCIKNKIYDIEQVNDILYACNLDLLTK